MNLRRTKALDGLIDDLDEIRVVLERAYPTEDVSLSVLLKVREMIDDAEY